MNITVTTLTGKKFPFQMEANDTIGNLKDRINDREGIPPEQQRLVFNHRQFEDCRTLTDCNIVDGSDIQLILRMRGG